MTPAEIMFVLAATPMIGMLLYGTVQFHRE